MINWDLSAISYPLQDMVPQSRKPPRLTLRAQIKGPLLNFVMNLIHR